MNAAVRFAERFAFGFNQLALWRGECRVWNLRFAAATFERWLYLRLHRLGRMGGAERAALERLVRPGMTVLDVGGNLGLYTLLLSRLVGPSGRIVTFEPDPELFALLRRNCELNGCANVEAHNLALGRRRDRLVLRKMILNSGDNTLGAGGSGLFRREVTIDVVALDEFLPGLRPDLVKIDVQGWELEVLRGMERTLAACPAAALYLEYWPEGFRRAGYTADDLVGFLRERGYRLSRAETGAELDQSALTDLTARLTGLRHADLLARRRDTG
jgi:FkbM family methyltransferase